MEDLWAKGEGNKVPSLLSITDYFSIANAMTRKGLPCLIVRDGFVTSRLYEDILHSVISGSILHKYGVMPRILKVF